MTRGELIYAFITTWLLIVVMWFGSCMILVDLRVEIKRLQAELRDRKEGNDDNVSLSLMSFAGGSARKHDDA